MNQLLCALSYYILGAIAEEATACSSVHCLDLSVFGVCSEHVKGSSGWPCLEVSA